MTPIASLIERLERLTGPDREVDAVVAVTVLPETYTRLDDGRIARHSPSQGSTAPARGYSPYMLVPELTSSLDAAVRFAEALLPEWDVILCIGKSIPTADVIGPTLEIGADFEGNPVDVYEQWQAAHPIPAIALVLAALKSMEARGEG